MSCFVAVLLLVVRSRETATPTARRTCRTLFTCCLTCSMVAPPQLLHSPPAVLFLAWNLRSVLGGPLAVPRTRMLLAAPALVQLAGRSNLAKPLAIRARRTSPSLEAILGA